MREVSAQWLDYIQMTTTKTLCKCLRVETKEGNVYGTTNHTRDFLFEGTVYYTSQGLIDTAIARTEGLQVDNMEFSMLMTEGMHIAIEAGKFDGAKCYFFMVDFTDLGKSSVPLATGYIGEVERDVGLVKAEILGLMSRLGRKTGRVYTIECDAILGDSRCRVPMSDKVQTLDVVFNSAAKSMTRSVGDFSFDGFAQFSRVKITGSSLGNDGIYTVDSFSTPKTMIFVEPVPSDETVTLEVTLMRNRIFTKSVASVNSLSPRRIFSMNNNLDNIGATLVDQWLFAGVVTFLTGNNAGESQDVSSHIGVDLQCYLDFPFNIQINDLFTISTGCDLLFETCKTKFNNHINHRGFPLSPSNEELFYSPAQVS